ncbi:MAG: hypothetical protein E6G50_00600 [Actinobacteria bacterium]|nr:MAG: hypothetical protein E6G50_00600 [Actinomycetota bacterium]
MRSALWAAAETLVLRTQARRLLLSAPPVSLSAADVAQFERFAAHVDRGTGDELDYCSKAPKHAFLRHLVETRDVLFHGTGRPEVAEFEPQQQTDYDGAWTDAVFASDDPIWPMFFATVNREIARSLINGCSRRVGESRYYFSISADPRAAESWRTGWIYIVPRETFHQHRAGSEWMSQVAVRPLARLRIEPTDFPFLGDVVRHSRTDPVPKAVLRATVGRAWGR